MGYTTSTIHGIEVPDSSEANNVPEDIGKVVTALEAGSLVRRLTGAQIAALTSPQKPAGLVVYNTTTNKLQVSNGSSFTNLDAAAVAAQATASAALPKSGGTMTGKITLDGAPSSSLHAVTKAYADLMLPKTGGTITGQLTIDSATEYSQVIVRNSDAAYWIGTDPGASNALTIVVLNKTTLAYVTTALVVQTDGKVTFPNGIRVPLIDGISYY